MNANTHRMNVIAETQALAEMFLGKRMTPRECATASQVIIAGMVNPYDVLAHVTGHRVQPA